MPYSNLSMIATKKGMNDQIAVDIPTFNPESLEARAASMTEA